MTAGPTPSPTARHLLRDDLRGMYAVATYRLSLASNFRPIELFFEVMVWFALAAWLATMAGLLRSSARRLRAPTAGAARASS
jgi:hypothetical protein